MLLESRYPGRRVGRIARQNLVATHDTVFHLVNPHQPTKLVGLMRFAFANDFGVRFEQTQHLALRVVVAAQHSLLGLSDHLLDQREKVSELADLRFHPQPLAYHLQSFLPPSFDHVARLSHHAPSQCQQLLVTVPHALLVGLGEALGGTADLQQTMFHRACVMHYFHGSLLALASDPFEAAAEHPDAIAQKRAVGGVVNVAFDDRGIGSNFSSLGYALLAGQADHPLMNLCGDRRAQ